MCAKADQCRVGFDALPEQLVHRSSQSGFCFNLLCVGEPSIGKSTLVGSLFALPSAARAMIGGSVPPGNLPVSLEEQSFGLVESGIRLRLRVIETRNYGNQTDKRDCHRPICEFIDSQFQRALDLELHVDSSYAGQTLDPVPLDKDPCIHACLYFIVPSGHSIKALDLMCMTELAKRTNLIPLIAKADALTSSELGEMKKRIRQDLAHIELYEWPTDDEAVRQTNRQMNDRMPFAVVGSSEKAGRAGAESAVRARDYKWGLIQVENEHHCDFVHLRQMLIRTNMLDLIDKTHRLQYENFRRNQLCDRLGVTNNNILNTNQQHDDEPHEGGDVVTKLIEAYTQRRSSLKQEMTKKEDEIKREFIDRVKNKEAELKEIERKILNELVQVKQWYREQKETLEQQWNILNSEIADGPAKKTQHTTNETTAGSSNGGSTTLSSIKMSGGGPFGRRRK